MGKITKKVQAIADNLQKVEKPAGLPATPEIRSVEPMSKNKAGSYGVGKKFHQKNKGKKEKKIVNTIKKELPIEKEEGFTGYAGFGRRIARGLEGAWRGFKFWFED